jgi:hypothetical protein
LTLLKKTEKGDIEKVVHSSTPALEHEYKFLKSMAHISVWLNVVLQAFKEEHSDKNKDELLRIKYHLSVLKRLNTTLLEKEEEIIHSLNLLIEQVLITSSVREIAHLRKKYFAELLDANKRYAQRATELQLNGMHCLMDSWLKAYTLNLEATRVLIVCAHGPKRNLIEAQYFLNLYNQHGIAHGEKARGYVIPVPMLDEQIARVKQEQLIAFLRKYILNSDIGKDMLDDDKAMTKDVLGPYAPSILKKQTCPFHGAQMLKKLSYFAVKKKITTEEENTSILTKK